MAAAPGPGSGCRVAWRAEGIQHWPRRGEFCPSLERTAPFLRTLLAAMRPRAGSSAPERTVTCIRTVGRFGTSE